ncbi:MAG: hypothetical protein DSY47_03025 [Hydrogenothermus sp.]|nr:MAG: hypothetical protein DSY47_03025 [Hydrogenothermus sp.]
MKNLAKCLLVSFLTICILKAEEIAVIAGKSFPIRSLSKNQIKNIFLKKRFFINGKKIIPVNLESSSKIRKFFEESILGMDEEEYNLYWNEMYFKGVKPPLVMSSQESVIKFVQNIDGAIGYVSKEKLKNKENIKVLKIIKTEE